MDIDSKSVSAIYIADENLKYLTKEDAQMLLRLTGKLYALVDMRLGDKLAEIAGYVDRGDSAA
jgi:hypothetical protein